MKLFIITAFTLALVSCKEEKAQENKKFELVETADVQFDIKVPEVLWNEIFAKAPLTIKPSKGVYEIFLPLPTTVELIEYKGLPMGGKNYKFEFMQFGGGVDWNTHLDKSEEGSINVQIYFPGTETEEHDSLLAVYFMSWTDFFERDGDIWGNGCGQILNVTNYFNKKISKKGLSLHTKDLRYLYGSAGRFYFVVYQKEKILISQVTFSDSQYESEGNYLCPNRI